MNISSSERTKFQAHFKDHRNCQPNSGGCKDVTDHHSYINKVRSCEIKAWKKKSDLNGIWAHDPCDTSAVVYRLSEQTNWHCTGIAEVIGSNPVHTWIFFRLYVATANKLCYYITVMTSPILISFSAVQICDLIHILTYIQAVTKRRPEETFGLNTTNKQVLAVPWYINIISCSCSNLRLHSWISRKSY